MPPEAHSSRPLAGDATRSTLEQRLAAARSGQARMRRRFFTVGLVAVAAVTAVAGIAYLASQFEFSLTRQQEAVVGESPATVVPPVTVEEEAATVDEIDSVTDAAPVVEVAPVVEAAVDESPVVEGVSESPAVESAVDAPVVAPVADAPVETVVESPSELTVWLGRAEVARVENRPEKEIAALQKILELDPARDDARARLQELRAASMRAEFAAAVARAQAALDGGDLPAAAGHIQAASAVLPGHEALQPLRAQLTAAQAAREFKALMALGGNAARQDDWPAAVAHFTRARAIRPNDSAAVAGLNQAQAVLDAARRVDGYLAQPRRLADRRVVDSANALVAEVESLARQSAKLESSRAELAAAVEAYLAEVEVVVVSDGNSDIEVVGVGQVGKTERRAIKLRPGARVFECSRRGYQSKRVPLDIAPGAAGPFEVTVICDQKI